MYFVRVFFAILCAVFFLLYPSASQPNTYSLVSSNSPWKYANDVAPAAGDWKLPSYNDSLWANARKPVIGRGADRLYLRHVFHVSTVDRNLANLHLRVSAGHRLVAYLNGAEIFRTNGSRNFTPTAPAWRDAYTDARILKKGMNVLALEVRNSSQTNSAVAAELTASNSARVIRGPYLQRGAPGTITIRWRTDVATDSRVRYSEQSGNLNLSKDNSNVSTEHVVTLTGLSLYTRHYYTVGTSSQPLTTPVSFFSYPDDRHPLKTRIWVIGDSGTASVGAQAVRNAYYKFSAGTYTNLMLMLGGNAYVKGADSEFQSALFRMYPALLRQTPVYLAIGEHDTAGMVNPPLSIPYYRNFDLAASSASGGVPSGSEDYYSFNYGAIHFVCLDSTTSNRSPAGPMLTWLKKDLAANKNPWLIAFWHHSPYSKGGHDSDREIPMIEMRQYANRILEYYGVDLVLGAHSNSYERSYLLNGHYGFSHSLTPAMILSRGSGRGFAAYLKELRGRNTGAVYVVVGSSGKTTAGAFNHPAMFIEQNQLGSLVVDVNANRLDARFLRINASVGDYFTIIKSDRPPIVKITSPVSGSRFSAGSTITISADAYDPDGNVRKVMFFAGSKRIDTDHTKPFSIRWSNAPRGSYYLTAIAEDDIGVQKKSSARLITIN